MTTPNTVWRTHLVNDAVSRVKSIVRRALPHPMYRLYRRYRVARLIATYRPRIVSHSYGGHCFKVLLADPLAEGWYDHDSPRLGEIDELVRIGALRAGGTVFDIGAHQGIVAMLLAAEVGPSGRIVAVEAEPHNAAIARRNVALNGARNVDVVHAAIADRPGTLPFAANLNGHVDATTQAGNVEVPAVTIDQLAERHGSPDLVFLDVEGYEGKALEGAEATLRLAEASFFIEVHVEDLVDWAVPDLISCFHGYITLAAEELPDGEAGKFAPLDGLEWDGRFFLIATPNP